MTTTINASTSAGLVQTADTSGSLALQTAGTTAITVDTSQNVGIGVTPSATNTGKAVEIGTVGNTLWGIGAADLQISAGTYYNGANKYAVTGSAVSAYELVAGSHRWYYAASGTAGNTATFSESMRINSSGSVLIGQTSSRFGGGLELTRNATDSIAIFENSAGNQAQNIRAIIGSGGNNTSSYLFVGSSNADNIYIYGNGNVVNRNGSYGTLSDIKLKENVVDASPKLADVMQLKVRNFNLKTDPDSKQIGFIAQELEQVFPALIDNTTSPNDPDDVIKAIKTSVLVPILVKAIQELKTINDQQAETLSQQATLINALTARIEALENK